MPERRPVLDSVNVRQLTARRMRRPGRPDPVPRSTGRTGPVTASYRELFALPALRGLALADVCARLPQGMVSIALLLVAAQHASMTVAGLVVAGYTLGQAVTGPVRGRLADRRGLVPVAAVCTIGYAAALLALLASALARGPAGLDIGTAVLAGLVNPPLSPGLRSLWSAWAGPLGPRLTQAAFALDAAVFDLAYITGPVLASALATALAPAAAALLAAFGVAGLVYVVWLYRRTPGQLTPRARRWLVGLRVAVVLLLLLCLANPERVEKTAPPKNPARTLTVLVDRSASMSEPDHRGGTRLAAAVRRWRQAEPAAKPCFARVNYRRFANEVRPAGSLEDAVNTGAPGGETHLFAALRRTLAWARRAAPSARPSHTELSRTALCARPVRMNTAW